MTNHATRPNRVRRRGERSSARCRQGARASVAQAFQSVYLWGAGGCSTARITRWIGFLFLSTFVVPCVVSGEGEPLKKTDVGELIRRLDSPTLSERSQAERQILDLGPAALPLLPASELIESVSARESVRRIRTQLERQAARESSRASRVTLEGLFPVDEVLREIQKQTANSISLESPASDARPKTVKIAWNQATFWECLDDFCKQGNFQWNFSPDTPSIVVSDSAVNSREQLTRQRVGPFRIAIVEAERRPIVGQSEQQLVRVRGQLAIEPRLRPLFLATAAADLQATANDGRSLAPWNPDARYEHPVGDGGRDVPLQWDFSLSAPADISEISIRGRIHCQIAASTERIVFDQTSMARGTVRRRGGVTVRLKDVAFEADKSDGINAQVGVSVTYDSGGPAFESHRTWIFHNAVYLETKGGIRTSFTSFETTQQSNGAVGVDYFWSSLAKPQDQYRFVYEAPTLIINVPVEIDLKKIPVTSPD